MADKMLKYLGIDYGKSKVGLSLAESETNISFAYGTLENNKDFFSHLMETIKKEKIDKVIIGIPSYINRDEAEYDGDPVKSYVKNKFFAGDNGARRLGDYLKNIMKIDVEYHNEMFTTQMAQEKLKEKGMKNIKRLDDQEAARIILQSWLDKNKNTF